MPDGSRLVIQATIKRATLAAHKAVEQLDAGAIRDLQGIYKQAAADISSRIALHAGPDGNLALAELRSALAQVEAELRRLGELRDQLLDASLQRAANLGLQPYTAAGAISADAGMRVSTEALEFVRNFVAEDGLQLSDRIWRLDRGARDRVVNAIEQAVIQGHSAQQAAREFLLKGAPVPIEITGKLGAANAKAIGAGITTQLMTGTGSPMDNAMRLMRTEINRAHGEAYMKGGEGTQGFAGWRYLLSPAHPAPDICDLLSTQNLYGLGPGVYPDRARTPWPAHPNTLSFIIMKFQDELTEADRVGKETSIEALKRLTPAQQIGALGKGKRDLLEEGRLTKGMIRTPLRTVLKRIKAKVPLPPPPRPPAVKPGRPARAQTLDEFIAFGAGKVDELIQKGQAARVPIESRLPEMIASDLRSVRQIGAAAKTDSGGRGAAILQTASRLFPADWVKQGDRLGPLSVRYASGRAWYKGYPDGRGMIKLRDLSSAVHEYTHRLQQAMPALDDVFQELHLRRTQGAPRKRLRDLVPGGGYPSREVAQEDKYASPYQGRIYSGFGMTYLGKHGALEVMTMAVEDLLGGDSRRLRRALDADREMVNLVVGLLYNYVP